MTQSATAGAWAIAPPALTAAWATDVPEILKSGLVWNRNLRLVQFQTDPTCLSACGDVDKGDQDETSIVGDHVYCLDGNGLWTDMTRSER